MWFIRPGSCLCRCRFSILNYYFWNIFIRGAGPLVIHDIRIMEAIFPWLTMIACVSQWYFIQDGTETLKKTFFCVCIFYFIDFLSRICHILIIVRPSDFSDLSYPSSLVPGSVYVQYLMWWERYGGIKIMLWRCRIWWKSLLKLFTVCYSPHARSAGGVTVATSASKSSIRRFVITEKAPTRAFSWLKAATTAFTFKTLC